MRWVYCAPILSAGIVMQTQFVCMSTQLQWLFHRLIHKTLNINPGTGAFSFFPGDILSPEGRGAAIDVYTDGPAADQTFESRFVARVKTLMTADPDDMAVHQVGAPRAQAAFLINGSFGALGTGALGTFLTY